MSKTLFWKFHSPTLAPNCMPPRGTLMLDTAFHPQESHHGLRPNSLARSDSLDLLAARDCTPSAPAWQSPSLCIGPRMKSFNGSCHPVVKFNAAVLVNREVINFLVMIDNLLLHTKLHSEYRSTNLSRCDLLVDPRNLKSSYVSLQDMILYDTLSLAFSPRHTGFKSTLLGLTAQSSSN